MSDKSTYETMSSIGFKPPDGLYMKTDSRGVEYGRYTVMNTDFPCVEVTYTPANARGLRGTFTMVFPSAEDFMAWAREMT